jgi:hypothetical protein
VIDGDQFIGLIERQRPEEDAFDDAEDGSVSADADGEREHRQGSKQRSPKESLQDVLETHLPEYG